MIKYNDQYNTIQIIYFKTKQLHAAIDHNTDIYTYTYIEDM
jgi:hypothetical protein